jgi:dTDP-4-amino-4,6-dideoxygalactose transaminase
VPFVDLRAQYDSIAPDVRMRMERVLEAGDFILGRDVEVFEHEFAVYCGVEHAIGVDSGTSALELALRALGVGAGCEVITVANTFIATALAVTGTGATPVFVDCLSAGAVDPALLEAAVTERTKAIVPVHLYGRPVDMDGVLAVAQRHGLAVVEDAAQAHGARFHGRRAGSLGDAAAFSFYPAKNLGAYGDGGAVVTNDAGLADSVRLLRNYGQREKYHHLTIGFNRRLDTLQAAVLSVKLARLDTWNSRRQELARLYCELLADTPGIELPPADEPDTVESVWHLFVIESSERDELRRYLGERGIGTGIHYPVPVHLQPAYAHLGLCAGAFPRSEERARRVLSLPMYPELAADDVAYVAQAVRGFREEHRAVA